MKNTTALLITLLFTSAFAMAQAPAAPPPLAALLLTTPAVPVVTHKFLAGTKFCQAVSGGVSS